MGFRNGLHMAIAVILLFLAGPQAMAQVPGQSYRYEDESLRDRPVSRVDVIGLVRLPESEVRNNLRIAAGMPYDPQTIRDDIQRLQRLGRFGQVDAYAEIFGDGSVGVRFMVEEQPTINAVQTVGNKLISDQDLLAVIALRPNGPRDDFLVQQSIRNIKNLYKERGHFLVEAEVDEAQLATEGIVIFKVIEGPRVKVRSVQFEGNEAFEDKVLSAQTKTRTAMFLFRRGQLDEDLLVDDVAAIDRYYRDRGYVDVRVGRRVDLSPDNREATVTFLIAEGRQYHVRHLQVKAVNAAGAEVPPKVFAEQQLSAMLEIRPGDPFSQDRMRKSREIINDAYGILGYLDSSVRDSAIRVGEEPLVDVQVIVQEGAKSTVGMVRIQGNFLTRDNVIRRLVRLQPGRPYDGREIDDARERLESTRLFNDVRVTVLPADPSLQSNDPLTVGETRDTLVEVKERNTGSVNFGVAVGTDSGFLGQISLGQTNFDITDYPESFDEFVKGRAFRGAGQRFQISLAPGADVSTYSVSFTEPYLFETQNSLSLGSFYRFREYDDYDEERLNFSMGIGRRLGDVWTASVNGRVERVGLDDFDSDATIDALEAEGPNLLTTLGVSLIRSTLDQRIRPGRGTRSELSFDQTGAMGGDFDFSTVRAEHSMFFTVTEDFLGRRSILKLNGQIGYIFPTDEAPLYERLYLGGRSFRGFEFRTISPKGIRSDNGLVGTDPVGGNWLVFAGAQYEVPIFEEVVNGVIFVDSGTVTEDVGLDDYRVSVGFGLRLYIRQFGPVPIAIDFGFPILKTEGDQDQLINFSADLPF